VFKMKDIKQQGLTTVEQILGTLTASQSSLGTSQAVGSSTGGASFADLRGVGPNKTLVLLNGRRIANNAFDGSAPDLNMIPMAAIGRIEVLRDSASALYGTDAIGGVINFITRKEYQGATVTLGADVPQHAGGKSQNANAGFGFGDLQEQGFNVLGFVDFQKQDRITGTQRPFNKRYDGGVSGSPSPGNYYQDPDVWYNPAAPACKRHVHHPGG
jgi:iron complex outermembrane receptor protein